MSERTRICRSRVIEVGTVDFARLTTEQRQELNVWVDQQVGHRLRGKQRTEYRPRFFRSAVIRVSGIVRVVVDGERSLAVVHPIHRRELIRFDEEIRVRTPLPWWWRP